MQNFPLISAFSIDTAENDAKNDRPGCSYWDTLRMGYKSSYWALLYLQAMNAYSSLQDLGVVDTLITPQMIASVKTDISRQFVNQQTGEVAAWISCDLPPTADMRSARDPTKVIPEQQTIVAYGFMPSLGKNTSCCWL